jgi:hypothetical protein
LSRHSVSALVSAFAEGFPPIIFNFFGCNIVLGRRIALDRPPMGNGARESQATC